MLTNTYQNDTRRADDFYRTPDWCADIGARIACTYGGAVLDPCAGDGSLMRAVERLDRQAFGIELDQVRADAAGCVCADAFERDWAECGVILMNPPFRLWQPFVQKAKEHGGVGGIVVLLRLGALAGQKRQPWWRAARASWGVTVHVLSRRPSFTGKGTDGADYAWVEFSMD